MGVEKYFNSFVVYTQNKHNLVLRNSRKKSLLVISVRGLTVKTSVSVNESDEKRPSHEKFGTRLFDGVPGQNDSPNVLRSPLVPTPILHPSVMGYTVGLMEVSSDHTL